MAEILMWTGAGVLVAGWISRIYLAVKSLHQTDDMQKFPERYRTTRLRKTYSRLAMLVGALIILISLYV